MISTHVLDTSLGHPAAGVPVLLQKKNQENWQTLEKGITNQDGRHSFSSAIETGLYQIIFEIENYLKKENKEYFFPVAQVTFQISNTTRKYHVPLLLNPFGYSTYRGS